MKSTVHFLVLLASACGGGDGGSGAADARVPVASGPTVARVMIDRPSVFLTEIGASARLTAVALDADGAPMIMPITWTSSTPDKIGVDAAGQVTAMGIGSAQVFAEAGAVRSTPALVLVAEPAPGALLVSDEQVVSVGPPLGLAPDAVPGIGTEYEVTLTGIATASAPGTVVLPTGLKASEARS